MNRFLVIDSNALENLFTAGGTKAWDQLLTGNRQLVILDAVLDEINGIQELLPDGSPNPNFGRAA